MTNDTHPQDPSEPIEEELPSWAIPLLSLIIGLTIGVTAALVLIHTFGAGAGLDQNSCDTHKATLNGIVFEYPDSEQVPADVSAQIFATGEQLRSACSYTDTVAFESEVVFPWLGVDPTQPPTEEPTP